MKSPRNPELAAAASLLHQSLGNVAEERLCLISVYKHARGFDRKRWVAQRIAELDAKTALKKPD